MNSEEIDKILSVFIKNLQEGEKYNFDMKILIDTTVFDELKEYAKKHEESMSMIATKAIKDYISAE